MIDSVQTNCYRSIVVCHSDFCGNGSAYSNTLYLVYNNNFTFRPQGSGAKKLQDPAQRCTLLTNKLTIYYNRYLQIHVSNGSYKEVSCDNLCGERSRTILITKARDKSRQINNYYPYGLSISGIHGNWNDYLNRYTSKELQTKDINPAFGTGLEMYDFHARFGACPEQLAGGLCACRRDPQLGRPALSVVEVWFTPDPAEQFHNPYLAMGRTEREESLRWSDLASGQPVGEAVVYVDPDGEFIVPIMMLAFMAGSLGSAAYADSKGVEISGREAFSNGLRLAAIAAMVASGVGAVAAKTTATKIVATENVVTKVVSKKAMMAKAGLKSGTINAVSNYDFESGLNGFGLETLANFGAGFAGGAVSVGSNWNLLGMMVGGTLNVGVGEVFNPGMDPYQSFQRYVGGAQSVYAGTGKYFKGEKLASKPFWKGVETFGKYGIQGTAYDFAYTDEKYFTKREGWEHAVIFGMGGLSGFGAERYFTGEGSELLSSQARISRGAGIYAAEWSVTSWIKQRSYARENGYPMGGFYTGNSSRAKGWLLLDKWRASSRGILLGQ